MREKLEAISEVILKALKIQRGNIISAVLSDAFDSTILEVFENSAKKAGAKIFLNNISFNAPIDYYFEQEENVDKAVRFFAGGLSFGMEYEYATNFNPDILNGISWVNYIFTTRRDWLSVVFPGKHKSVYSGLDRDALSNMIFDAILVKSSELEKKQKTLKEKLTQGRNVIIKGDDIDLKFSIDGKRAVSCHIKYNIPDGEVFIAPVEGTMEGWIHYDKLDWGLLQDVNLCFSKGRVVSSKAKTDLMSEWLYKKLMIDEGAACPCEFGIGTNEKVTHMVGDSLWDEKKYGTFHIALGGGYGSKIQSIRHWDMVKDNDKKFFISIDGDKILENGKILL